MLYKPGCRFIVRDEGAVTLTPPGSDTPLLEEQVVQSKTVVHNHPICEATRLLGSAHLHLSSNQKFDPHSVLIINQKAADTYCS